MYGTIPRVGGPLLSWWQGSKLSIRRSLLPIRCKGALCRLHSSKLALESTKADSEIIKWSTSKDLPEQPGTCCMKGHGLTVSRDGKTSSCCVTGATFEHGECIGEERQNADAFDVLRKR